MYLHCLTNALIYGGYQAKYFKAKANLLLCEW